MSSDFTVKNFTIDGKCSNCGQCCTDTLPMTELEVKRIKSYIAQKGIKEQRHNVMVGIDMTCPFRDDVNKKCLIYPVRPAICRQFMCNQSQEQIEKAKTKYHTGNRVVFMRYEFFGNTEDIQLFVDVMKGGLF